MLTVTDGGYHASFTLSGSAAAKYVATSDGAGGTLVRAVAGSPTHALVQAAAAFGAEQGPAGSYAVQGAPGATSLLIASAETKHR